MISNLILIIAGGDVKKVKRAHAALALSNIINNNNTTFIHEDSDICFIFYSLLNKVFIFNSIYQGSYCK